jgi:3-dehydroquinate synthase
MGNRIKQGANVVVLHGGSGEDGERVERAAERLTYETCGAVPKAYIIMMASNNVRTAHRIAVALPGSEDRSYTVVVESGLLDRVPALLLERWDGKELFLLTDTTVARLYGRTLHTKLVACGNRCTLLDVPPGEHTKDIVNAYALMSNLLELRIRRDSLIIALGGGVIGDLAGFVAATVLRGVPFVQIPTTVLAQVDSSVGGKVGIDHPLGKNLIGAFHQPRAVYADPAVLRSLSAREYRNGWAEVIKIAAALDADLFQFLERHAGALLGRRMTETCRAIARAIALKAAVVEEDEKEAGLRKVLNLGHTIGHAVEQASGFRLKHGEAVAIGLACEARVAQHLGLTPRNDAGRIVRLLTRFGLPTGPPRSLPREMFFAALGLDKKAAGDRIRYTLPGAIGSSVLDVEVPARTLERLLP